MGEQRSDGDHGAGEHGAGHHRLRVVVVGLGDTGVLVATRLARAFDVVGIATRPALVSGQELGNRLADPGHWRRSFLVPFRRFRRLDRVRTVHGRVASVDLERCTVRVERADGGVGEERYDVLVVASGASNGFWRHDRVETLAEIEAGLTGVAHRVGRAGTLAVVGGGATGVSVAANLARRPGGPDVHLFYAQDEPLPGYHPKVRRSVVAELERSGVHLHPGHRAEVPEGFAGDRLTTDPITWSTGQPPFTADLTLWAVGAIRPHSGFLPADVLDEGGFVRVDEHLRVPGHRNVFAVGDVAASDPHRSSARNWGYFVVARNVRALAAGRRLRRYRAPEHRWGSVFGLGEDGLVVYQPDGSSYRVPRWAADPLLFRLWLRTVLYGGLRRDRDRARDRGRVGAGASRG